MKLSDIAEITAGHAFRGKIATVQGGEVTVVQIRDIKDQRFIDWPSCINTRLSRTNSIKPLKKGELLFMSRAESSFAVHIDEIPEGQCILAAPYFFVIRFRQDVVEPRFIAWLINQTPSQLYFQRAAEGTGRKNIRKDVLSSLPITLPSIEQQRAIIQLDKVVYQEMQTFQDIVKNNEKTMTTIAYSILNDNEGTRNNA